MPDGAGSPYPPQQAPPAPNPSAGPPLGPAAIMAPTTNQLAVTLERLIRPEDWTAIPDAWVTAVHANSYCDINDEPSVRSIVNSLAPLAAELEAALDGLDLAESTHNDDVTDNANDEARHNMTLVARRLVDLWLQRPLGDQNQSSPSQLALARTAAIEALHRRLMAQDQASLPTKHTLVRRLVQHVGVAATDKTATRVAASAAASALMDVLDRLDAPQAVWDDLRDWLWRLCQHTRSHCRIMGLELLSLLVTRPTVCQPQHVIDSLKVMIKRGSDRVGTVRQQAVAILARLLSETTLTSHIQPCRSELQSLAIRRLKDSKSAVRKAALLLCGQVAVLAEQPDSLVGPLHCAAPRRSHPARRPRIAVLAFPSDLTLVSFTNDPRPMISAIMPMVIDREDAIKSACCIGLRDLLIGEVENRNDAVILVHLAQLPELRSFLHRAVQFWDERNLLNRTCVDYAHNLTQDESITTQQLLRSADLYQAWLRREPTMEGINTSILQCLAASTARLAVAEQAELASDVEHLLASGALSPGLISMGLQAMEQLRPADAFALSLEKLHAHSVQLARELTERQTDLEGDEFVTASRAIFMLGECCLRRPHASSSAAVVVEALIARPLQQICLQSEELAKKWLGSMGPEHRQEREYIYHIMLQNMDDTQRLQVTQELCTELLGAVVDDKLNLDAALEPVVRDALAILASKDIKVGRAKEEDDDEELPVVPGGEEKRKATQHLVSKVAKRTLIENIVPMLLTLKTKLEEHKSPLQRPLLFYLREVIRDNKAEMDDVLAANRTLASELAYDLKALEAEEGSRRCSICNRAPDPLMAMLKTPRSEVMRQSPAAVDELIVLASPMGAQSRTKPASLRRVATIKQGSTKRAAPQSPVVDDLLASPALPAPQKRIK
ncbi:uncharacterized protein MONBRDRAFT_11650 [Monosiga brevicollis MX1]|uniref:Condensin complex subunit 1 C-terminal domain-containing protein n=1 Tax=Monosiga brevicollis TaxID=81824 RepID=A9V9W3_MONBE|nr:uncharacterized protein MONBRDRAFT_11650 [Monosiga brevicollis MX1]EDQ85558.1 predicted protein [Monosiga brevicollis MX1]|eukprot:XP_001749507.1 hypothetical protein [Monosiga brevicollis MX1]